MDDKPSEHLGLYHEHGLSFYVDTGSEKLLFDFGSGSHTVANAEKLDVPLKDISFAIGSHGHYDHAGGYPACVDAGLRCPLVTGKGFFTEKYAIDDVCATYLGNGFDLKYLTEHQIRHLECDGMLKLSEDAYVLNAFARSYDFETIPERFVLRHNGEWVQDNFTDEICLVVKLAGGVFVIVGCSHPGILNILTSVEKRFQMPILGVAGGTHLMEASDERIRRTLTIMEGFGISVIGFNHCSGDRLRSIVGEYPKLHAVYLGAGDGLFL